jgi:ankyrin repeat protein
MADAAVGVEPRSTKAVRGCTRKDADDGAGSVAAGNGDVPMLKMLLQAGADTRLRDHDGSTAQAWAAHGNHAEAVRLLQE